MGAGQILREKTRGQSELCVVGYGDGFCFGFK